MQLARDNQDLDDDQIWEALEALQMETAQLEEVAPPHRLPWGSLRVPGGKGEADMDDGKVSLRGGGDGDIVSPHSGLQVPLGLMQMSAVSSTCLQLVEDRQP